MICWHCEAWNSNRLEWNAVIKVGSCLRVYFFLVYIKLRIFLRYINEKYKVMGRPKPMAHKAGYGKGRPYEKGGHLGK